MRQAAGLATETLAAHIGQRVRWAQGMAQILRVSNPLTGRGLTLGQRLCYLNASFHFLYGLPRLIFLLGPLAYLVLGAHICAAAPGTLLAYLLPHLLHAMIVDAKTRNRFRYAFWNNVYETVLAIYILVPVWNALLRPRSSVFKVTDKGTLAEGGFDRRIARPYLVLLLLELAGLGFALSRLVLWDYYDPGTVLINLAWSLFSLFTLGAVLAVACESRQVRRTHRLPMRLTASVRTPSGHAFATETRDLSLGGALVAWQEPLELCPGEKLELGLFVGFEELWLPAQLVERAGNALRLRFSGLTLDEESDLVQVLFGRPDAWIDWERGRPADHPLRSLGTLLGESFRGIRRVAREERRVAAGAAIALGALALLFLFSHTGWRVGPVVDRLSALGPLARQQWQAVAPVQ